MEEVQEDTSDKGRDREVDIEILVIGISTYSTMIVHIEQRLFHDDAPLPKLA